MSNTSLNHMSGISVDFIFDTEKSLAKNTEIEKTKDFLKELLKLLSIELLGFKVAKFDEDTEDNVLKLLVTHTNKQGYKSAFISTFTDNLAQDRVKVSFRLAEMQGYNQNLAAYTEALVNHIVIAAEHVSKISDGQLAPRIESITFGDDEETNEGLRQAVVRNLQGSSVETVLYGDHEVPVTELCEWMAKGKTLKQWKEEQDKARPALNRKESKHQLQSGHKPS